MQKLTWIVMFFIYETKALSAPSYISPWILMDSDDPSTTFQTLSHGFGVRPVKVEVQVMSPTTGFIYPGVKSAYAGNDDNDRGGVICIYNDNDIRLYGATNAGTELGTAYIINTGITSWTSENQEQSKTGYVRVRAWHPDNLPSPSYTTTLNMKAGNMYWNDYEERNHALGTMPVLTIVQYTPAWTVPLSGWVSEGQGSSSRPTGNSNLWWGGLVYAVDSQDIRLWAPSSGQANYGIFSFCDGWGWDVRGDDCFYIRADVTITVWTDLSATEIYSHTDIHEVTETSGTHEISLFPEHSIDIDNDIVTVAAISTFGQNNGFLFYGTGAAMVDNADGCGGIVYAYSNVTSSVRVWHPADASSNIIHVVGMGGGTFNQESWEADVEVRLFKVSTSVINYCEATTVEPGINTNTALTDLSDGCMSTYTCFSGYIHFSGNLQRFYDFQLGTWSGTIPECQVPTTTSEATTSEATTSQTTTTTTTTQATTSQATTSQATTSNPITTSTVPTTTSEATTSEATTSEATTSQATTSQATPSKAITTSTGSVVCFNTTTVVNVTTILRIADEIVANLTIPTKTTSKYLRSLTSAKDSRQSSRVIGVAGASMCAFVMGLLFIPDVITLSQYIIYRLRE